MNNINIILKGPRQVLHSAQEMRKGVRMGRYVPRYLRTLTPIICDEEGWSSGCSGRTVEECQVPHLDSSHYFVQFVVKTSGVLGEAAEDLIWDLGRLLHRRTL